MRNSGGTAGTALSSSVYDVIAGTGSMGLLTGADSSLIEPSPLPLLELTASLSGARIVSF